MEPIDSKLLKERVVDRLRAGILNGELKPGQPLVGSDLANQLGVSSATLREAIQALSVEGFIEALPYRVPTVKKLSRKDIEDLFNVRSMLEAFAIRQIIMSDKLLPAVQALHELCAAMRQAAENDSLQDMNRIDHHFHETLIRFSGNDLLGMLWSSVAQRVQQAMALRNRVRGDLFQIARNHLAIVTAIESADVEESVRLIDEHICSVGDEIADSWNENLSEL